MTVTEESRKPRRKEMQLTPEEQEIDRQITAFVEGFAARFIQTPPELGETATVNKKLTAPNLGVPGEKIEREQIHIEQSRMFNGGLRTSVDVRFHILYEGGWASLWIWGDTPHVNPELDNVAPLPYPPSSPIVRPRFLYGLATVRSVRPKQQQYGAKGFASLQRDIQAGLLRNFRFGSDITGALANAVKPPTSS